MRKSAYIITLWVLVLAFGGCDRPADDASAGGESMLVNLDLAIRLSDVSQAATRAEYVDAATEDELMHTLRIIVVRPDNTVEDNRLFDLTTAADRYRAPKFTVAGNEWKRIYLIANEATQIATAGTEPVVLRKLVDYDLGSIAPGHSFPREALANLEIRLDGKTDELRGPLPMSESHRVWMPNEDHSCSLWITRAAVKFTFRLVNRAAANHTYRITGLTIDKLAHKEYLLPRDATYATHEAEDGTLIREITDFSVPLQGNNGYYTYGRESGMKVSVPAGDNAVVLDPIYLLEGKFTDPADKRNYSMSLWIDGAKMSSYFPALSLLPRNTHVVVTIVLTGAEAQWQVELVPYTTKILEPSFGLDEVKDPI